MTNARRLSRRRPRGVVSIELLLLMPFFGVLLFSVYLLGDIMFVQEKTELAARYAAWKRRSVSGEDVRNLFFPGQGSRNMVQGIEVNQGLADRRYPTTGGADSEATQTGALGAPPRFLFQPLNSAAHSSQALRAGHIAVEGNTGGQNKAAHQSYFGTDQPATRGGGGWVNEHWGTVLTSYRPMGYTTLSLKLAAAHKVLLGKEYHAEMGGGGWWSSTFRFRQAAVNAPMQTGIAAVHDEVNSTSWEYSGLMKELYPQP